MLHVFDDEEYIPKKNLVLCPVHQVSDGVQVETFLLRRSLSDEGIKFDLSNIPPNRTVDFQVSLSNMSRTLSIFRVEHPPTARISIVSGFPRVDPSTGKLIVQLLIQFNTMVIPYRHPIQDACLKNLPHSLGIPRVFIPNDRLGAQCKLNLADFSNKAIANKIHGYGFLSFNVSLANSNSFTPEESTGIIVTGELNSKLPTAIAVGFFRETVMNLAGIGNTQNTFKNFNFTYLADSHYPSGTNRNKGNKEGLTLGLSPLGQIDHKALEKNGFEQVLTRESASSSSSPPKFIDGNSSEMAEAPNCGEPSDFPDCELDECWSPCNSHTIQDDRSQGKWNGAGPKIQLGLEITERNTTREDAAAIVARTVAHAAIALDIAAHASATTSAIATSIVSVALARGMEVLAKARAHPYNLAV